MKFSSAKLFAKDINCFIFFIIQLFVLYSASLHAAEKSIKPLGNGAHYEWIGRYDINKLNTILTEEQKDFNKEFQVQFSTPKYAVNLYRVTYTSVIPDKANKPTQATGLVAIPETGNKKMPMVSYQHGTVWGKLLVPSYPDNSYETKLMIAQFAGQGYIVIGADYFGLGDSTEKDGFIVKASHQQACLDMYFSALKVLEREKIQMTDFFLAGWSQGGFVTMAFLEKLENMGIPLKAAATASAPTDALAAFTGFLSFPRSIDAIWLNSIFTLSSFAFEEYYSVPGLAKNLINPDKYETAHKLYLKELDEKELLDFVEKVTLKELIRSEYFKPQYLAGSDYGKLLKEAQTYRWAIQTQVRNYYGESDEVISIGIGKLPLIYQWSMGNVGKVEAISTGATNHRGTFIKAVDAQKQWFDSLLR